MNLSLLLTLWGMLDELGAVIEKVGGPGPLREKVAAVVELARTISKKTPTPLDDQIVTLVDKLGVDRVVALIELGLTLLGYDESGRQTKVVASEADMRKEIEKALKDAPQSVSISLVMAAIALAREAFELFQFLRNRKKDGAPEPLPAPVFTPSV